MSGRGNVYSPELAAALRVALLSAEEAQALAQQVREVSWPVALLMLNKIGGTA